MDDDWLVTQFEGHRPRLRGVALRMLGSAADADDAVQETWIRLSRSDAAAVDNLGGWLTTVVGRVALDMLRSRRSRRDQPHADLDDGYLVATDERDPEPERDAVLADSVGSALLVVLDALAPAERLAFVLHDNFGVPFDEIGVILDRSADAARQLAYRARRKVQGRSPRQGAESTRHRGVVDAFLRASRAGDFDTLVELLHPGIVLSADRTAVSMGSPEEVVGAEPVAAMFSGRAQGATVALIDGAPGLVWAAGGRPKVVWRFAIEDEAIVGIVMIADPEDLAGLAIEDDS